MWQTRKRSYELLYSLLSFVNRADDNDNVEYIIVTDPDDEETADALDRIHPIMVSMGVNLISIVADSRYGYAELEAYQNIAAKHFTGECLFPMSDDNFCVGNGWDSELRKGLEDRKGEAAIIAVQPLNEEWKGNYTVVGVNRKWYEKTNRFSGNRATDSYLMDLARAIDSTPIYPNIRMLHLQRGKPNGAGTYTEIDGTERTVFGLPAEDDFGGYSSKNPIAPKYYHNPDEFTSDITDFVEGKRRFDEDFRNLKES